MPSQRLHRVASLLPYLVLGIVYFVAAELSLRLSLVEQNVTPLWPPTGIALAAFALYGKRLWPGVCVAAFAVNLPISTPLAAAITAVGNTLAPLVAAVLLERTGFHREIERLRDALAIVAVALVSATISASLGAGALAFSGEIAEGRLLEAWSVWWAGDAMGMFIVAPLLFILPTYRDTDWRRGATLAEAIALVVLVVAASFLIIVNEAPLRFLIFPLLAWPVWRFQQRAAAPLALVVSLIATWSVVNGNGDRAHTGDTLVETMLALQVFNAAVALFCLCFGALVTERLRSQGALEDAAANLEERVRVRTKELAEANQRLEHEVRDHAETEGERIREHTIAMTLQRALLPERLPEIDGMDLAVRYSPAGSGASAGGDWYDVLQLPDGCVMLVVGDVGGHGLEAASVMGNVRVAVRAYGLEGHAPDDVMARVHALLRDLYTGEQMVTLLTILIDPASLEARIVNAGHPPPILLGASGEVRFLHVTVGPPLGFHIPTHHKETRRRLEPGDRLILYTDGLIDRRDLHIDEGLRRLEGAVAAAADLDLDGLCGALLSDLTPTPAHDDIAILAVRLTLPDRRLVLRFEADPEQLARVRRTLERWLTAMAVDAERISSIVLASSEACTNSIEHAYGPAGGRVELEASFDDGGVVVSVHDHGRWKPPRSRGRGRGLTLIDGTMDSFAIDHDEEGTTIRMRSGTARRSTA